MMTYFAPLYSLFLPAEALAVFLPLIVIAALWTIVLKGFALWFSARAEQKWWFVAMLVINTIGILELIYLIWFRPKNDATTSAVPGAPEKESSPAQ